MTTAVLGSCVFGGVYLRGSMGQALRRPEPTSEPANGRTPRRVEGSWLGPIDCLLELGTPRNLGVPRAGGTVNFGLVKWELRRRTATRSALGDGGGGSITASAKKDEGEAFG